MKKKIISIVLLLFICFFQLVFSQTVVETFNNELKLTMNYDSNDIALEFENISKIPISFSWEYTFIKSENGQYLYDFPLKTELIMPGKKITKKTTDINVLHAEILEFQYKIRFSERSEAVKLFETKLFHTSSEQNTAVFTPIEENIQPSDFYKYEWDRVSSIRVPNGWMEKDSYGRILSVGGFNSGAGISIKQYFSPVKVNSWNGFWEYGVVALILPYIEIGSDYVWDSGWYAGISLNLPFTIAVNFGRYF